ncbi:peptidoglycan recognition protein family protein [Streptomyces purpureus]|uniref:peptidoglycan recognition protein family protein n=1 Tax=Streptomyces purpureus TaxID=1951 RepID=UPI00035FA81B|nr:N-acetylmuramoyl-L-alanine amidase [Streptomyces purpureus]
MRAYLASAIGVACTAALAVPFASPTVAAPPAAPVEADAVPGSTQSLPLAPLGPQASDRIAGSTRQGLPPREVRPFSLVGVVWDDATTELHGTVQVRTRPSGSRAWSGWQDLETHNHEHAADPGSAESASRTVRGATAPLWVGASDAVEVRVQADGTAALPGGLRLELVDPGQDPVDVVAAGPRSSVRDDGDRAPVTGPMTAEQAASSAVNADLAPLGATIIPALGKAETEARLVGFAKPYIGPRPKIVTRKGWGADEKLREKNFAYTKSVKTAFVHHTVTGNNYTCKQVPSLLRSIYRYHVVSSGWRDIGYNFAVDKCGNIYEGRAGGVSKPVQGAHTRGFNTNSMGVAVLGTFTTKAPPTAAVNAIARLTAWKLGLYGVNPRGTTYLTSGGGNLYKKGTKVKLKTISGHRDGFATECPGKRLYSKLGTARTASATLQGRT